MRELPVRLGGDSDAPEANEETLRLGWVDFVSYEWRPFLRHMTPRRSEPVPNKANVEGSGTDSSLVVSPPEMAMAVDPSRAPRSILTLNRTILTLDCTVMALIAAPRIIPVKTPASA
jgi:hypothetical protein